MKHTKLATFHKLRQEFKTAQEMGDVIFKSDQYIYQRMNGNRTFTHREKMALLNHIGKTEADIGTYFPEEDERKKAAC